MQPRSHRIPDSAILECGGILGKQYLICGRPDPSWCEGWCPWNSQKSEKCNHNLADKCKTLHTVTVKARSTYTPHIYRTV